MRATKSVVHIDTASTFCFGLGINTVEGIEKVLLSVALVSLVVDKKSMSGVVEERWCSTEGKLEDDHEHCNS